MGRYTAQPLLPLTQCVNLLNKQSYRIALSATKVEQYNTHVQTYAYSSRPTVLISLLYLFRQCAYFSTGAVLISLPSLFQSHKFFQCVPKTLTIYRAIK